MTAHAQPLQIGISGSYGGMNLGDEAILAGMLSQLRATVPAHVTVFSRNPGDTLARHQVERSVPVRRLTRKEITEDVKALDLLILGGGGILYDGDAETYLREVLLADELGVPVFVYAISAGPLTRPSTRETVRAALNEVTMITVRDREAYRLLEDIGITREIHLTADPAFLLKSEVLPAADLEAEGVNLDLRLVGFSVREPGPAAPDIDPDEYYSLLANTADFVIERLDTEVLFVSMEPSDVKHSHAVVAHMRRSERAEILRRPYSAGEVLDIVGRLDFAVGMRLHFLIFSAMQGTPFVALPYASKVVGFLDDLAMDTPSLGGVGVGQLIASVDRSWDTREEIRARLVERVPDLKRKALRTNELLVQTLNQL